MHLLLHLWNRLILVVPVVLMATAWSIQPGAVGAEETAPAQPTNTLRDPFQPPPLPKDPTAGVRRIAPSPYSHWQRSDTPPAAAAGPSPGPVRPSRPQTPTPQNFLDSGASPEDGGGGLAYRVPSTEYSVPSTQPPTSTAKPIAGGQIVARIGNEVVLDSELLWEINRFIRENSQGAPASEIDTARQQMIQKQLMKPPPPGNIGLVDTKLLYGQVRTTAPPERLEEVRKNMSEQFEAVLIPRLMKFTKTESRGDLEANLRRDGSSIAQQREAFLEREIAMGWLGQQINRNPEITHADMLAYYQEHASDYDYSAQVLWDEVMVRFDRLNGDREAAKRAVAAMGNQILVQKRPLAEVAKESSHGFTASDGGRREWTSRGSLAAKNIDAALFSLPIGAMSQILEGKSGWHIVRVVERKAAGKTSFLEIQEEIQKRLKRDERNRQIDGYLSKLRRQTKVWTVFSGETTADALIDAAKSAVTQ